MIDAATTDAPASAPTFAEMTQDVYETNKANGWFDEGRTFGDDMALTISEVSEMFEAFRDHGLDDATAPLFTCDCLVATSGVKGMHHSTDCAIFKPVKPEGLGSECADVLVRILDTCYRHGVELPWDLLAHVPDHRLYEEATVGTHVFSLTVLLTKATEDLDSALVRTIMYLVAFCKDHDLDLQAEFDRKLAYNKTRGYRHGGKRI